MHTIEFTTMNPMADFHVVHSHVMGYHSLQVNLITEIYAFK